MFRDALSASLSLLCDETGLSYAAASRLCHCSSRCFRNIVHRVSVPNIDVLEGICDGFGKTPNCLLQVTPDMEKDSYRTPMRVEFVYAYRSGKDTVCFPICPRCVRTMEREYQSFCDRCGQRLSWHGFNKAAIIMRPD